MEPERVGPEGCLTCLGQLACTGFALKRNWFKRCGRKRYGPKWSLPCRMLSSNLAVFESFRSSWGANRKTRLSVPDPRTGAVKLHSSLGRQKSRAEGARHHRTPCLSPALPCPSKRPPRASTRETNPPTNGTPFRSRIARGRSAKL